MGFGAGSGGGKTPKTILGNVAACPDSGELPAELKKLTKIS